MLTFGSLTSEVRSLAVAPTLSPAKLQWIGRPIWWTTRPPTTSGPSRRVTRARASMAPRGVRTVTQPAALLLVPPHELLPLRPGPAVGIGRGAVVHDAAVGGPGEAPLGLQRVVGPLALAGAVAVRRGEDAAVDPAAARRRAVVLQFGEATHQAR